MDNKTERRSELSAMNILLCLLVIFIHTASSAVSTADRASWQYAVLLILWRASAFAVQGFIFLAGVKLALGLERKFSYPRYLLARVKRVLLPYLIAFTAFYLYFILRKIVVFDPAAFVKELLTGGLVSHFYFVVVIMQFYLLAPLWRKLARWMDSAERICAVLICALFVGQMFGTYMIDFLYIFNKSYIFPYSDRIFTTYLFFWIAGLAAGSNYERVKAAAVRSFKPLLILCGFAFANASYLSWIHFTERESIYWLEMAQTFYIISAIALAFALSVKFGGRAMKLKSLVWVDRASYSIYLWHPLALFFADELTVSLGGMSILAAFAVRAVFAYLLTIPLCAGIAYLISIIKHKKAST